MLVFKLNAQKFWTNISDFSNFYATDILLDTSGKAYVSIHDHEELYELTFNANSTDYLKLPRFSSLPYDPFNIPRVYTPFFNFNGQLVALSSTFNKLLVNGKFVLDTVSNNGKVVESIYKAGKTKFATDGRIFINDDETISEYTDPYLKSTQKIVFDPLGITVIYDFEHLDDETNYAFCSANTGAFTYDIYKFNSKSLDFDNIIRINENSSYRKFLTTKDRQILIPTVNGLMHFKEDGITLSYPIIDTNHGENSRIRYLVWSKRKDFIIALLDSGLFLSYDTAKTWVKPFGLNNNFPKISGNAYDYKLLKLELLDSLNGMALIMNPCNTSKVMVLRPYQVGWDTLHLDLNHVSLDVIKKTSSGTLIAYSEEECHYQYLLEGNDHWNTYFLNGKFANELVVTELDNLLSWIPLDSVLYRSENNGLIWKPCFQTNRSIHSVYQLSNQRILLFIMNGRSVGDSSYDLYLSQDDGLSWSKTGSLNLELSFNFNLVEDNNGNWVVFDYIGSHKKYISRNEGNTWEIDTRFNSISALWKLQFTESNEAIFTGAINGVGGLFRQEGPGINKLLKARIIDFGYFGNGRIYAPIFDKGIDFSWDFGDSWIDLTKDIPFDLSVRIPWYTSSYLDEDGHFYVSRKYEGIYKTYEPLVSVKEINHSHLEISPNPAYDVLRINWDDPIDIIQIQIIDLYGKCIKEVRPSEHEKFLNIQLSNLPEGFYYLQFLDRSNYQITKNFIKFQ
ncbi:MAG: T9SS type A sorting domain-containing protein [Saprospiraceae bacterium]|nr:T9SS type A sorting domain-containing protein [Saprospiraceae bacterium]MBK7810898.1 T9SS type A sorting domain-containing protein [Saprospiraceae bacterium]MBK9630501.1 T9SS type A sorting domain-containing protein [Saprospiraceae bacterium]